MKQGLSIVYDAGKDIIQDPQDRTTIFTISEQVAQDSINQGNIEAAISIRMQAATSFPPVGPLGNIQKALEKADDKLGVHLYPIDTSLFKNHSLMAQKRTFEGQAPQVHVEAKINHLTRKNMEATLNFISQDTAEFQAQLPPGFCNGVTVRTEDEFYLIRKDNGDFSPNKGDGFRVQGTIHPACVVTVIHFQGVGTVRIADSTTKYNSIQNRIAVDLDPSIPDSEAAEKLAIILSAFGLGAAASGSRPVDEERIKVLQLFRAFYPMAAYELEQNAETFSEPIESLISRIETKVPEMQAQFKRYLKDEPDLMYKQEVYPGRSVWCVKGLADEAKKAGAIGLMAGLTAPNWAEAQQRILSIFKTGALSTQDRFQVGILKAGDSSGEDLRTGGASSVFARIVTDNMPTNPLKYPLRGEMQILYDLKVLERVGFAYQGDRWGSKEEDVYSKRSNIVELTKQYKAGGPGDNLGNEVCVNQRVGPESIKGLLVKDDTQKNDLIELFKQEGLLTKNTSDEYCINGVPVDQFIHIGEFSANYWA